VYFVKRVYLAGPITGLSFEGCTDWREYAIKELDTVGITGLSPMRSKDYLQRERIVGDCYDDKVLSCARGIITRDRWDTTRCDIILVNLLGAEKVSIGTIIELAWADLSRTPSIVVMEPDQNVHEHSMVREMIGFRVETLEEGLNVAKAVLLP
jgi:nucleoside 2-deoxyribosyltransferase